MNSSPSAYREYPASVPFSHDSICRTTKAGPSTRIIPTYQKTRFGSGAISRPVLLSRIAQCRFSSCMIRIRVCRRWGSFSSSASGGRLRTRCSRPLKVQKVFCHCIHICGVIPPKASGAAEWRASQSPNPQKICRNSVRSLRRKKVLPRRTGSKKNPSPPYCVFCRNIHPPAFSIHPKVFFMA